MNYKKVFGYAMGIGMAGLCAYLIKDGMNHKDMAEVTAGGVNSMFSAITGYVYMKEDVKESVKKLFSHKDKHTDITDKF